MQRFSFFVLCMMCANAANSAYLPTVDVSRGGVSARAAFGEEIAPIQQQKNENVASVSQKTDKKVVARSAKKSVDNNVAVNVDVLRPNRPHSDLWARSNSVEQPLRMPRMDEIAVLDSDAVLPEENLDSAPKLIARDEALNELKQLRSEIARLSALQQESIAHARPVTVRTPISGETKITPAVKSRDECDRLRR